MTLSRRAVVAALLCLPAARLHAGGAGIFTRDGLALGGTDVVAYFAEGRALAGRPEHAVEWQGARWLFASEENRRRFEEDPQAYAPQFGGYCAYAVSKGALAPTDPEAWTIVDGKLYLNFSPAVRERWAADREANISRAEANWPRLSGE